MNPDYQKREEKAVSAIKGVIPAKLKQNLVKQSAGMFTELYENNDVFPDYYCATCVDGVGTKVIIAEAMGIYDTIGIDCVAMNSNDMATCGKAAPFMFVDYLACQNKIEELGITGKIMKGMVKGLELCECSDILRNSIHINLGKGETASVDELMGAIRPGFGFDLAGAMIGFIKKSELNKEVGNTIIALKSSGPHSNGFTDLRMKLLKGDFEKRPEFKKNYKGEFSLDDNMPDSDITVGKALLEPTIIYNRVMADIASKFKVTGINNTGYGLKNFNRLKGYRFTINSPIKPQLIFDLMQKESKYSDEEMYKRFNMGMGFFVIADKEDADGILSIAEKHKHEAKIIGSVEKSDDCFTVLEKDSKKIIYKGY